MCVLRGGSRLRTTPETPLHATTNKLRPTSCLQRLRPWRVAAYGTRRLDQRFVLGRSSSPRSQSPLPRIANRNKTLKKRMYFFEACVHEVRHSAQPTFTLGCIINPKPQGGHGRMNWSNPVSAPRADRGQWQLIAPESEALLQHSIRNGVT